MSRIIYLAGPMKGYPERNYPMFNKVTATLRAEGHRVYNPAEFPENRTEGFNFKAAFAMYSNFICLEADTIVLLPGWEKSSGVVAELGLAIVCGVKLFQWDDELEIYTSVGPLRHEWLNA